jgi:penicillin-binding protein 2
MYREDSSRYKKFSRRAAMLGGAKAVLLSVLAGRMYQLQVLESDRYKLLAEENRINMRLLPPPRGRILDRAGLPLAGNRENFRVVLIAERTSDVNKTLDELGELIPVDEDDRRRIMREIKRRRSFVPITVRENLDWGQVSRIEVHAPYLPGIVIDVGQSREYPYGSHAAHVLGYVSAVTEEDQLGDPLLELPGFRIGKSGVEKHHDLKLRGKAGNSQLEVNALGRIIRELSRQEGQPGDDIGLTIDLGLQKLAVEKLEDKISAAAVAMDVNTGAVIAMASVPGYDPNVFNIGLSQAEWRSIVRDPHTPLTNKAISGLFAPGSTFKMMVALAAIEHRVIPPETTLYCKGHVVLGNARFHCWKKHGHGWLDLKGAIEQSCDTYFYEISKRLGIDKIAEMATRFGLGEMTDIDLPGEKAGLIPTAAWKKRAIGEPWQGGETLVTGIGQGFVLTTPLQLAVMTARIATGRQIKPHLVRSIISGGVARTIPFEKSPPLKVPKDAMRLVKAGMDAVMNSPKGTARGSKIRKKGWEMAGKTGTAQVKRISKHERDTRVLKNKERPWKDRDHALFVCYAPIKRPRYAVAVVVEHGGGGSAVAAPVARDIMLEALRRDPSGYNETDSVSREVDPEDFA